MSGATLDHAQDARSLLQWARARSPLPPVAWVFWLAVVSPAAVAIAVATHAPLSGERWTSFALLTAAASAAQLSSVQLTRSRVFHPAIVFVVAGSLLLSPQQLVLMCAIHNVPDWLKHRYPWYIQSFNIANYVLAGLAASTAARGLATFGASAGSREAAAGVTAVVVFIGANRLLLAPMLRLGRGVALRASGLFGIEDLGFELVLALMAVPLAALWTNSVWLASLALAPLVLIHLSQRTTHRLELASETITLQSEQVEAANTLVIERSTNALEALSATVDARDAYTAGHSRRVRDVSVALGAQLGLGDDDLEMVGQAALLHDIGKIAVPDSVLLKTGSLTEAEWIVMKSHSEEGARIIERLGYLDDVVPAIRHHHERQDGRGYPLGLRGDEIPLAARIIHVADALDAMLTKRVYREARSLEETLAEIRQGSGTDFCSACTDALDEALADGLLDGMLPRRIGAAA